MLAESVRSQLDMILGSDTASTSSEHPVQQTRFAIDEVILLARQGDLEGALDAARDAAKEWRLHREKPQEA